MSIAEKLGRIARNMRTAYEAKKNIIEAFRFKNADVSGLSFDELPQKVLELDKVMGYGETEFPASLRQGTLFVFVASNGDTFFSTDQVDIGIWWLNKESGVICKVYEGGRSFRYWFQGGDDVFVSSSDSAVPGILWWNGSTFISVYEFGYGFCDWYLDSGSFVVYVSGLSGGVLAWDGFAFRLVWDGGKRLEHWYGSEDGRSFVSGSDNGIFSLGESGLVDTYGDGRDWKHWFESGGDVFVSSGNSGTLGIVKASGSGFVKVYSLGYGWEHWFSDGNGNVFVSSEYDTGILKWNGTAFVEVYSSGRRWKFWFSDNAGNIFVSSGDSGVIGIYRWTGTTFSKVYDAGYAWEYWFLGREGDIFVSSSVTAGILRWNGSAFVQVHSAQIGWQFWCQDGFGNIFVSTLATSGIYNWNGSAFVRIYTHAPGWEYWSLDEDGYAYALSNSLAGMVKYVPEAAMFEVVTPTVTGRVFAKAYSLYMTGTNPTMLFQDGAWVFLDGGVYTDIYGSADSWAVALNGWKDKLLYLI